MRVSPLPPLFRSRGCWGGKSLQTNQYSNGPASGTTLQMLPGSGGSVCRCIGRCDSGGNSPATSRPPIVESEDDSLWNIKLDRTTALDPVSARRHGARLTELVRPRLAVDEQWATAASVVINDGQVRTSILRGRDRSTQMAITASRQGDGHQET